MATAAAAIMAKARRRILDHLMAANAVSPDSAVDFEPREGVQTRQFQRLQNAGVVRATPKDQYWIDIPVYRDWANRRRRRIAAAVIFVAVAAAIACSVGAAMGGIAG